MKNLLAAQSGGPTSAINATLAGVIAQVMIQDEIDIIYGGRGGIEGILQEQLVRLDQVINNTSDLTRLIHTPASALGSCRFKLADPADDESQYRTLTDIFRKYQISYFIYIGGNDSMDTVDKLSRYLTSHNINDIRIIGAPKTIDNDLAGTDHCPGFPSAAQYIAATLMELERDLAVYASFGVTIVEIMGRNAGWLTAAAALARTGGHRGPDLIYLCERPFSPEQFLQDVLSRRNANRPLLVAVSEGLKDEAGHYLAAGADGVTDVFGHRDIAGTGTILKNLIRDRIGCKVRAVEFNLLQRCAAHLASPIDLEESRLLGAKAVTCALAGYTGQMVTINRLQNNPYTVQFSQIPVSQAANREKTVPLNWINPDGNDVTPEMMDYLQPLTDLKSFRHFII